MIFGIGAGAAVEGPAQNYDLAPGECHGFPGAKEDSQDVTFGIVPTRPLSVSAYYNPIGREVVQKIQPGILHPIPVLRARFVRTYDEEPALTKIGRDTVATFESQAELTEKSKFAIVGDASGTVALLTLSNLSLPQDQTAQWHAHVKAETLTLEEHVANPISDVGRAAIAKQPIARTGRLLYGVRRSQQDPTTVMSLDLAKGTSTAVATVNRCRVAPNGTVVDRIDDHTLKLTDASGKPVGEVKLPESEIDDFNVSADATHVVIGTERLGKPTYEGDIPAREVASIVFDSAGGKPIGEFVGYDDACFLPDGRLLVTASGSGPGLSIADLATGKVALIRFRNLPDGKTAPDWPRTPAVSPDGKRVAFASYRDVYVADLDGKNCAPLWSNPQHEPQTNPTFSPDGTALAIINVPLNVMHGPGDIYLFDLARRERQTLEAAHGANSEVPLIWAR